MMSPRTTPGLFDFRRGPKLFILPGDVRRHARLHAVNYRASF